MLGWKHVNYEIYYGEEKENEIKTKVDVSNCDYCDGSGYYYYYYVNLII
jgi:hypothetical protein